MNNPLLPRILPLLILLLLAGASTHIARAQPVILDGTRTLQPDPTLESRDVLIPTGAVITLVGEHRFANLTIAGTVTHRPTDRGGVQIVVNGRFQLDPGGRIDVSGAGYLGAFQPGNSLGHYGQMPGPDGSPVIGSDWGAAGSHGSPGLTHPRGGANPLYGSETAPTLLGSGGGVPFGTGQADRPVGGNGGGRIQIRARDLVIDGSLSANGGPSYFINLGALGNFGGGSGGSIYLISDGGSFSGAGILETRGGEGGNTLKGGLGRIAVVGFVESTFTGQLTEAGSIFTQRAGTAGHLRLRDSTLTVAEGETRAFSSFDVVPGSSATLYNRGVLAVDGDHLVVDAGITLVQDGIVRGLARSSNWIGQLTVRSNALVTHSQGRTNGVQFQVLGTATVERGGRIDVSGSGYLGGLQPGNILGHYGQAPGPDLRPVAGAEQNAGGSHATLGAAGFRAIPNPIYGSEEAPTHLGSGGGVAFNSGLNDQPVGGNGGGRIQIRARDFIIDGALRANGNPSYFALWGTFGNFGGGSGGSIYLISGSGSFSGEGILEAKGGAGGNTEPGGLGRIAIVQTCTNTFAGTIAGATITANTPPTLRPPAQASFAEDTLGFLPFTATDVLTGSACLSVSAFSETPSILPPSGVQVRFEAGSHVLMLKPATNAHGTATLVLMASDGTRTVTNRFNVEVTPVNDPPTLAGVPDLLLNVGTRLTYTFVAFDIDDTRLTFTARNLPVGAQLQPDAGRILWTPGDADVGNHDFHVTVTDPAGLQSTQPVRITVKDPRRPVFTQVPSSAVLSEGDSATLTAAVDRPAGFQWRFNGNPIPGAVGSVLSLGGFTPEMAGSYTVAAINAFGQTLSPPAQLSLRPSPALVEGPRGLPEFTTRKPNGSLTLRFQTVPGRTYLVKGLRQLRSNLKASDWQVLDRFVASGDTSAYNDPASGDQEVGFYDIEEVAQRERPDVSFGDRSRFQRLSQNGQSLAGVPPEVSTETGRVGPVQFTLPNDHSRLDHRLSLRLPDGGTLVTGADGRDCLQTTNVTVAFPPESPIQFGQPMVATRPVCVPLGPLTVADLERMAGIRAGEGVPLTIFRTFQVRLTRGTFHNGQLEDAALTAVSRGGVAYAVPDSSMIGGYDLRIEATDGTFRIPFIGAFTLRDGSSTPFAISIPTNQPAWLVLRPDGSAAFDARVEARIAGGPAFDAELSLDDPLYRLRIEARNLGHPALSLAPSILLAPTTPTRTTLDADAARLRGTLEAVRQFHALTGVDLPSDPGPAERAIPDRPPGGGRAAGLWRGVIESGAVEGFPRDALALIERAGMQAAASTSPQTVLQYLLDLIVLHRAADEDTRNELTPVLDEAIAAARRTLIELPIAQTASDTLTLAHLFRDITQEAARAGIALAPDLRPLANGRIRDSIGYHLSTTLRLSTDGWLLTNSPIPGWSSWELQTHLQATLDLRNTACLLDPNLAAGVMEGQLQSALDHLARHAWSKLEEKLAGAALGESVDTYANLCTDLATIVHAARKLDPPGRDLPKITDLRDALRKLHSGPLLEALRKTRETDPREVRLNTAFALLRTLDATRPFRRSDAVVSGELVDELGALLASIAADVGEEPRLDLKNLVDLLAGLGRHEEFRILIDDTRRPRVETLNALLPVLLRRADTNASPTPLTHVAGLLLAGADHLAGRTDAFHTQCPDPHPAPDSSVLPDSRLALHKAAARLLTGAQEISIKRWERAVARQVADPAIGRSGIDLPGGFAIDEAVGELVWDRLLNRLRGTAHGRLRVPEAQGTLEILNASFDSGGKIALSVAGELVLPPEGSAVRFTVSKRRPLKVSVDNGAVRLSGGGEAKLRNGTTFEAWATLEDPNFRFGIRASGLHLQTARHLAVAARIPNRDQLLRIPGDVQSLFLDYARSLGQVLDPLTDLTEPPAIRELGNPPTYDGSILDLNTAPLEASSTAVALLIRKASAFGYDTVEAARAPLTNAFDQLALQLDQRIDEQLAELREFDAAATLADRRAASLRMLTSIRTEGSALGKLAAALRGGGTAPPGVRDAAGYYYGLAAEEFAAAIGAVRKPCPQGPPPTSPPVRVDPRPSDGVNPPPSATCALVYQISDPTLLQDPAVLNAAIATLQPLLAVEQSAQLLGFLAENYQGEPMLHVGALASMLHPLVIAAETIRTKKLVATLYRGGPEADAVTQAEAAQIVDNIVKIEVLAQTLGLDTGLLLDRAPLIDEAFSIRFRVMQLAQRRVQRSYASNPLIAGALHTTLNLTRLGIEQGAQLLGITPPTEIAFKPVDFDVPCPAAVPRSRTAGPAIDPDIPAPTPSSGPCAYIQINGAAEALAEDQANNPAARAYMDYLAHKASGTLTAEEIRLEAELEQFRNSPEYLSLAKPSTGAAASLTFTDRLIQQLPQERRSALARIFAPLYAAELESLRRRLVPGVESPRNVLRVTRENAVDLLRTTLDTARNLERWNFELLGTANDQIQELERVGTTLLPALHLRITALAEARQDWWLLTDAAAALAEGLAGKLEANHTAIDRAALDASRLTTEAAVVALQNLVARIQADDVILDLQLPSSLVLREAWGQVSFNTDTRNVQGCLGGELEFPELRGLRVRVREFCLATDGSFAFTGNLRRLRLGDRAGNPFEFNGSLDVRGRVDIPLALAPSQPLPEPDRWRGWVGLTGTGTLARGNPPDTNNAVAASLTYTMEIVNGQPRWRLGVDIGFSGVERLSEDAVVFKANAGFGAGASDNSGSVSFRAGGKVGLWRKDRSRPLPESDADVKPELFQLVIDDVEFEVANRTGGFGGYPRSHTEVRVNRGSLRLPALFRTTDLPPELRCELPPGTRPGPAIGIDPAHPIVLRLDIEGDRPGIPQLDGTLTFAQLGFSLPGFDAFGAILCHAELAFESNRPSLFIRSGRLNLPLPAEDLTLGLRDVRFGLDGLPVGELALLEPFTAINAGGVRLRILSEGASSDFALRGSQPAPGTRLRVFNPDTPDTGRRFIQLAGTAELTFPVGLIRADQPGSGGRVTPVTNSPPKYTTEGAPTVGASLAASITIRPGPDSVPQFDFALSDFSFGAPNATWRLGGMGVADPHIAFTGLTNLGRIDAQHPVTATIGGTVILEDSIRLSLINAKFEFFDITRPPRFVIGGLAYAEGPNPKLGHLPVRVTRANVAFVDPRAELPDRLKPQNVVFTVSARVELPPGNDALFVGELSDVRVGFDEFGRPLIPSLDGFELALDPRRFKVPPFDAVTGRLRIGGLASANINEVYLVGDIGAKMGTSFLKGMGVFSFQGPIGMCFDGSLGSAGVTIPPTPFVFLGGQGGISFAGGGGDPCDIRSYFDRSADGRYTLRGNTLPDVPVPWSEFRAIVSRMAALLPPLPGPLSVRSGDVLVASPKPLPTPPTLMGGPTPTPCPDCPPASINLLCQPHPDIVTYSNRVILKFSAISESQLNTLGITRETITGLAANTAGLSTEVASRILGAIRTLTPRPTLPGLQALDRYIDESLVAAQGALATSLRDRLTALATSDANRRYDEIVATAWEGVACQDISLSVAGRVSVAGLSTFAYLEGRRVTSTAGSEGYMGTFNIYGIPVGHGEAFVMATDANGNPNPSLCANLLAGFGPLDVGRVTGSLRCENCVTAMAQTTLELLPLLGEDLLRRLILRSRPELLEDDRTVAQALQQLATQAARERTDVLLGFLAEILSTPIDDLPGGLGGAFVQRLGDRWNEVQPELRLCGVISPRLFGIPLTGSTGADFTFVADKQGYQGAFAFSPSYVTGLFPPGDRAELTFDLRVRDPLDILLAGLDGRLSSPDEAARFAREQLDYAAEHMVIAASYQWHPFGLELGDAAMRVVMPDFTRHPALSSTPWLPPEQRNAGLPSRSDVLVAAAIAGKLGDAAGWKGSTADLAALFADDPETQARITAAGVDLRRDYFPHGGFLGGARMALPKLLVESPTEWLPIYNEFATNGNVLRRLELAGRLIEEHILRTETNGTATFYLPAPNPPNASNLNRPASDYLAELRDVDLNDVNYAKYFPSGVSFLRADMTNLNLFGIPIAGTATLRGEPRPTPLLRPEPFAQLSVGIERSSWIGRLLGRDMQWTADLYAVPPQSVRERLWAILLRIRDRVGNEAELLQDIERALASNLPRFAFTNHIGTIGSSAPLEAALGELNLPPHDLNDIFRLNDATLYAFSPLYDPGSTNNQTPVGAAAQRGGIALRSGLTVFAGDSRFEATVPSVEFAVTEHNGLPRLVGRTAGLALRILPQLDFSSAQTDFDTARPDFLRAEVPARTVSLPHGAFTVTPVVRGAPAKLSLRSTVLKWGPFPVTPTLTLPASRLRSDLLSSTAELLIHGSAGPKEPFQLSPTSADATVSFENPGGELTVSLPFPGSPNQRFNIARFRGLPEGVFSFDGGLDDFTLRLATRSTGTLRVQPLPGFKVPASLNLPELPELSFTLGPSASVEASLTARGRFSLNGRLGSSIAISGRTFSTNTVVTMDNQSFTLSDTDRLGSLRLSLTILDNGTLQGGFDANLSLAPFCILDGLACVRGPGGGNITGSATEAGFTLSGVDLVLAGLLPGQPDLTVPLPPIDCDVNGALTDANAPTAEAIRSALANGFNLGGFPLSAPSQLRIEGNPRQGTLRISGRARLQLRSVLDAGVSFAIANSGLSLQFGPDNLNVVDFGFTDVTLSAQAPSRSLPSLSFSGKLNLPSAPWGGAPRFTGSIPATGGFDLLPERLTPGSGGFPFTSLLASLRHTPGDLPAEIRASQPAGYWRLNENIPERSSMGSFAAPLLDSGSQPLANGFFQPVVPSRFASGPFPPRGGQPGARGLTNDTAVLFDGVDDHAVIPNPADRRFHSPDAFAIELWFRRTTNGAIGSQQYLASRASDWSLRLANTPGNSAALRFQMQGALRINGTGAPTLDSSTRFDDTEWHHVVGVFDGAAQILYVDGRLDAWQVVRRANPESSAEPIVLAAQTSGGSTTGFFNGSLDEVAFYRHALTPDRIIAHHRAAGRGGLGFQADFGSWTALPELRSTRLSGLIGPDGSVAATLASGGSGRLGRAALTQMRGLILSRPGTHELALRADIAPLAPLRGSPLRLTARLPVGQGFEAYAAADRWILGPDEDPVLLNEPTATFSTVDAAASVRASLVFPRFLGGDSVAPLQISSRLSRADFTPTRVEDLPDLTVGPGRLDVTSFNLSTDNLKLGGSFRLGGRTFAGAQLLWTPRGGFHLNGTADTGWQRASVPGPENARVFVPEFTPLSMRAVFALEVEVAPVGFSLAASGTFGVHSAWPDNCPTDIRDSRWKLSFDQEVRTDGLLPLDLTTGSYNRFLPDLW